MKVTLVSNPPDDASGTGNYAAQLAAALGTAIDVDRISVPVDTLSPLPFLSAVMDSSSGNADAVHVQFDYVVFGPRGAYAFLFFPLLYVASRVRSIPVVVTAHEALNGELVSPPLSPVKRGYVRALNRTIAAAADHVVFLSEQAEDRFTASLSIDSATVIPHGVAVDPPMDGDPAEAKRRFGFEPDDTVVVEPGYVSPRKGTDVFVSLAERCPEYEFLVAGGPPREKHRPFFDELRDRAPDNVTLTDRLPEETFHAAFAAADAALLPYREVAQTGVVNPVNQSGVFNVCAGHTVPVAASDCPRFRAVNGRWDCPRLFDPDDLEDVERALRTILEDGEAERLRAALSEYARANSFERVAEEHVAIYGEVRG